MASAGAKSIDYRPDIDGLRAIAVLSVFFYHLNPALLPGGFLGVDVFFVISGYLITAIIVRENRLGTFSFSHFYARRVKRIFPALFVVLVLSALVAAVLLVPETYVNFMHSARYAAAQIANFFFSREVGYFEEGFAGQPLLHTWSLGVEEQFYLCWPLLIFLCFRLLKSGGQTVAGQSPFPRRRTDVPRGFDTEHSDRAVWAVFFILALLSFAACFILAEADQQRAFYMFYTRAWEFCIGGVVALRVVPVPSKKATRGALGAVGLLLLCYSFWSVDQYYLGKSFLRFGVVLPCIGAALIIFTSTPASPGPVNRLLATGLTVGIGKISYSLYLYHWPVLIFFKNFNNNQAMSSMDGLAIIAVSFILAILSYYLVEQPARKTGLPDRRVLGAALLVIIISATTFNLLENHDRASWRITRYDNETADPPPRYPPSCVKDVKNGQIFYECRVTETQGASIIALVGDSHAPHYLHALVSWAGNNGYDVRFLSVPGCPMLLGGVQIDSMIDDTHEKQCSIALPLFATEIVEDPDVEIIMFAQRFDLFHNGKGLLNTSRQMVFRDENGRAIQDHTAYYRQRLVATVAEIRAAGKEPVFLKQVPILGSINACDWQPRLKKWLSQERDCSFDEHFITLWQQPSIDFIDELVASRHVPVFDPFPYIDAPLQDGVNIYVNFDHLNVYGFQVLIPYFPYAMDTIMADIRAKKVALR